MQERPVLIRADYGTVALRLKELMEERGITRNQLAKLIDARFEVVSKWYQGNVEKMDLDILARICYALDCSVAELLVYVPGKGMEGK
ncbi:MAG: helix-turn-helix transcriptional regulator [Anaerotignum sp.]|jgi:putative transcriptional regulator|nr:helix-turn-helix transcriptional regulator [Anaerotignum sp.]